MIFIDHREPDLPSHFRPFGDVEIHVMELEYGDACFIGNGPDGSTAIGVERKYIHDLISSMREGRLTGHQLSGMIKAYPEFRHLIVEGLYRPGDHGELEIYAGSGQWKANRHNVGYREVDNFLVSMGHCGFIVDHTATIKETAAHIVNLYLYYGKEWDEHKAHKDIYGPVPVNGTGRRVRFIREVPSLAVKFAAQLPGIDKEAWPLGKKFRTAREFTAFMATADDDEWNEVLGIKKGRKTAENIQKGLDAE